MIHITTATAVIKNFVANNDNLKSVIVVRLSFLYVVSLSWSADSCMTQVLSNILSNKCMRIARR